MSSTKLNFEISTVIFNYKFLNYNLTKTKFYMNCKKSKLIILPGLYKFLRNFRSQF